ncbi:MAG: hypothetical protein JNL01_09795 [Bdellovibrionales bacterium]|nr:hypothetical protein [Bdellovibrionales bacterium]
MKKIMEKRLMSEIPEVLKQGILAAGLTIVVSACSAEVTVSGVTTDSGGGSGSSSMDLTSCSSEVIDYGTKGGGAATVQRGQFSSVAMIPGTSYPAVAYIDGSYGATGSGANVIKFRYYNGTTWVQEIVGPAGVARQLKLAFLSTGSPILFWSDSSQEGAATNQVGRLRFAARNSAITASSLSTSTWSTTQLHSVTAAAAAVPEFVGIDVAVSPTDAVLVTYLSSTGSATNNRAPRMALCLSDCTSASNYNYKTSAVSTAADNVASTAQVTTAIAVTKTAAQWCKSGSSYYPAMMWPTSNTTLSYAVCNNATLSNCTTPTTGTWNANGTVLTPAGTNVMGFDMVIDPTVDATTGSEKVKVAVGSSAGGIRIAESTTNCDTPGTMNWTVAGQITGTPNNFGQNGNIELMKDPGTGTFHIIGNNTNTAISYTNTSGSATPTAFNTLTSWNTLVSAETPGGATVVQSTTVLNLGNNLGAAFYGTGATSKIYLTYATAAATIVTPAYQMRVVQVQNPSVASNSGAQAFAGEFPDTTGNISIPFASANPAPWRALKLDHTAAGIPAIAYTDYSETGGLAGNLGKLKFAVRNGSSAGDAWTTTTVASSGQKILPYLHYAPTENRPYIAAFDASVNQFVLYKGSAVDGGTFTGYSFPSLGTLTAATNPISNEACLAHYTSGGVEYIVMVALVGSVTTPATYSQKIVSAQFNTATNTFGALSTTPASMTNANGGYGLSCISDSSGNIGVAYVDQTATVANGSVRYVSSSDGGVNWGTPLNVGSTGAGTGASLTLHPTTEKPALSYYQTATGNVFFASCSGTVATCGTSGWSETTASAAVGTQSAIATSNAVTVQALRAVPVYSSSGDRYVIYSAGPAAGANAHLMYTKYNSTFLSFDLPAILTRGNNIASAVAFTPTYSVPMMPDAQRSSTGSLSVAYIAPGNYLGVTTCGD